jgi:hypothetical protein
MKKKLFLFMVLIFICYPALFAQARFVIAVEGLKIRTEPDLAASSMGIIPYGTQVWQITALKEWKRPWAKIRWNGKVGWVYAPFLSEWQTEPRSAITEKSPTQSLLVGTWYSYDPYCLEQEKFSGDPYDNIASFSNYHFDDKGHYSERHWEGGAEGGYILSGSTISIEGEAGYVEMESFSVKWDISLYQIRSDWLVMEVMIWITDDEGERWLNVFFLIRPLSAQAQQKVDTYFEGS